MRSYGRVSVSVWRLVLHPCLAWSLLLLAAVLLSLPGARCRQGTGTPSQRPGSPSLGVLPNTPTAAHRHSAKDNETCTEGAPNVDDVSDPRASCLRGASTGQNKARRLAAFQKDMLAKLGLETVPPRLTPAQRRNASHIQSVRTYIAEQVQRQQEAPVEEEEREHFRASRVVTFAVVGNDHRIFFNLTDRIRHSTLDKSWLHVFIRGTGKEEGAGAPVASLALRAPGWGGGEMQIASGMPTTQEARPTLLWGKIDKSLVEPVRKVPVGKDGRWISFRLDKPLRHWLDDITRERMLTLDAQDEQGRNWAVLQPEPHERDLGMYLDVQLRDKLSRGKRSLPRDCREEAPASYCCRYPLTVNFSQLGWDFVLHPPAYEAYYCSGDCQQHAVLSPGMSHAFLSASVLGDRRRHSPDAPGPTPSPTSNVGPCCAAHKAQDMELMYMSPGGDIVIGTLPGMSVLRCACT